MDKSKAKLEPVLKDALKDISTQPGIYMMLNKKGEIIYIGKAKNLKSRVRTYLNIKSWNMRPKLYFMMPKVSEIKTVVTSSEKEALILEANLVHKHQPRYNVTLKDDKKFPWLMITSDEKYPRVVPIRDVARFKKKYPKTKNKFFGPYSDAGAMWEVYGIIKEGFLLRLRRKPLFNDRPCMNYHIGLCSGPCQQLISDESYKFIVKQVEDFLNGKYGAVIQDLKKQMKNYSDKLEYEKAGKIKQIIQSVEKVLEKQIVVSSDIKSDQDVFAYSVYESNMLLELLIVRSGKVISIESMVVSLPVSEISVQRVVLRKEKTESRDQRSENSLREIFTEAIKQYYIRIPDENIPKELIVQTELVDEEYICDWLTERAGKKVKVTCPKKGLKYEVVNMAMENARLSLERYMVSKINDVDLEGIDENILESLKERLNLKYIPNHIECFDISHLGGTNTVASMIAFINGKPATDMYRKFNVKSLPTGKIDDFESMREVVHRRYSNVEQLPDLIVIDGGKGQLSAAKEAFDEAMKKQNARGKKYESFPDMISLAKREEEVFKPSSKQSIVLGKDSKELQLLQRVRNEAHRFAITFQRQKRNKDAITSKLEKIPGLGKAKIKRLMNYYGSLKNIQESDLEAFAEVLGEDKEKLSKLWEEIKNI